MAPRFDTIEIIEAEPQQPLSSLLAPVHQETPALGRHQTFHLRDGWLLKALRAVSADPFFLSRDSAHLDLGVGKNMLAGLRFWASAAGLIQLDREHREGRLIPFVPTPLADLLRVEDPYLEDQTTLWVIHTMVASHGGPAAAWYWMFNEADFGGASEEELSAAFGRWLLLAAPSLTPKPQALRRELSCVLRTYIAPGSSDDLTDQELASPLAALELLSVSRGAVRPAIGPKDHLTIEAFVFALLRYAQWKGAEVHSIDDLRWEALSPGRLLCLDSTSLLDLLQRAEAEGFVRLALTAGLRNVTVLETNPLSALERYYARAV